MKENAKMTEVAKKLAKVMAQTSAMVVAGAVIGAAIAPFVEWDSQLDRRKNIKYMQERFNALDQDEEGRQTTEYKDLKSNIAECEKVYQESKKTHTFLPKWYQRYYSKIVGRADEYK